MTFIAFSVGPKRAEIVTDTVSYSRVLDFGRATKCIVLPHMDAAMMSQGDNIFGAYAQAGTQQIANQVADFDELLDAQAWLLRMREEVREEDGGRAYSLDQSTFFLAGWSPAQQRFVAQVYASDNDFEPLAVDHWMMPTPWTIRPSDIELNRSINELRTRDFPEEKVAETRALWCQKKPLTPPNTRTGWIELAKTARTQRTLGEFLSVMVAGDLIHTTLRRGSSETRTIHTFDDEGEFDQMVGDSFHPRAQELPCWCGSTKRSIDCHMTRYLDDDCFCGRKDKTFGECCAIA